MNRARVSLAFALAWLPLLAACNGSSPRQPAATPRPPVPPGAALFGGAEPAKLVLSGTPLDVDPAGNARYLVRARFADAAGRPTELVSGGDVEFVPSHGVAQWQTRLRFGGPAAIVSTTDDGPLVVRVRAAVGPTLAGASVATDTRTWHVARVAGRALGPHAAWLGWFPRETRGAVRVVRRDPRGPRITVTVNAPSSGYRDDSVTPGRGYRYEISRPGTARATVRVAVPFDASAPPLGRAIDGSAMWLSFSPSSLDADGYDKLDAAARVAQAATAHLHAIVVRTAYGPFWEMTDDARPTLDALIDGAAARGIATLGWTVPRGTDFDDLHNAVATAAYVTAHGRRFAALAVDLERGDYYMGSGQAGRNALATYVRLLREALGPRYPLVATIEDPALERLSEAEYPYREIAAASDALEPMAYWPPPAPSRTQAAGIGRLLAASFVATRAAAGRSLPIVLCVLSSPTGSRPAPGFAQIGAILHAAHGLGARGVAYFDWNGTPSETWRAIGAFP